MVTDNEQPVKPGPAECGHAGPAYKDGRCVECGRERARASYRRNAEKIKASRREAYHADQPAARAYQKAYYEANREKMRRIARAKERARSGILNCPDEPPSGSPCEVCGAVPRVLEADHDHASGRFRGWLCHHCNSALGKAQDSVARLEGLINYLRRTQ